jgi:SHS2 domain-containing protein
MGDANAPLTVNQAYAHGCQTPVHQSQAGAAEDLDGRDQKDVLAAFDVFVETWGVKYDKAVECLAKDRDALLAFYDFPAEHWKHLRTTNVIESSFAARHRTVRSESFSREIAGKTRQPSET